MDKPDLVIRNAKIVTAETIRTSSLLIKDGKILAVGRPVNSAAREINAEGMYLLPGMIDVHVHFMDPGEPEREDFPTASTAAARSGVTTILEHTHSEPIYSKNDFRAKADHLRDRSLIDYGLGAHFPPEGTSAIRDLFRAGCWFIKVFTNETHGLEPVSSGALYKALKSVPSDMGTFLVHAEDDELINTFEGQLRKENRTDWGALPEWRHPLAEQLAVETVSRIAGQSHARVAIAHCSHPAIVNIIRRHRTNGANLWAEFCPQYLRLYEDEVLEEEGFRKFTPPARARSRDDLNTMWRLLRNTDYVYLATDHAPSTKEQKASGGLWDVPFGLPGIDTTLPLMIDAVLRRKLSWTQLVERYALRPAQIYGLYPNKGTLEPGTDADFILVDPETTRPIKDEQIISRASWSPYSGLTLQGDVIATYMRGTPIVQDGEPQVEPGFGRLLLPSHAETG